MEAIRSTGSSVNHLCKARRSRFSCSALCLFGMNSSARKVSYCASNSIIPTMFPLCSKPVFHLVLATLAMLKFSQLKQLYAIHLSSNVAQFVSGQPHFYKAAQFVDRTCTMRSCMGCTLCCLHVQTGDGYFSSR